MTDNHENLFQSYLDDDLSPEQESKLITLLQSEPAVREDLLRFVLLETQLTEALLARDEDQRTEELSESLGFAALVSQSGSLSESSRAAVRPWQKSWLALASVAAALVIAIGVWSVLSNSGHTSHQVVAGRVLIDNDTNENPTELPAGVAIRVDGDEPAEIRLSDGSQVRFEPASRAVLHGESGGVRQVVELVGGAGTFQVLKGEKQFQVRTSVGDVTVLGTEFTVELLSSLDRVGPSSERLIHSGTGENEMKRNLLMAVVVLSGLVQVDYDGKTYTLAGGQSKVFGQEEELPPAKLNEQIEKLVQQLGDQDFNVRQRASERLFEIGEPALPALQRALKSPDAEVVVRVRKLLSQIPRKAINRWIAQLREPTFNADVFLRTESQRFIETGEVVGAQPPLLGYYREAFGDKKNAREYYVALLRKKPAVFVMGQNYLDASPPASQQEQLQQAFVELLEMEVEQIAQDQVKASRAEPFQWRGKFHDDIAAVMVVHAATEPELGFQSYDSLAFRIKIQSKPRDSSTAKGRIRNLLTKNDLQKQMLRPVLTHCWSKVTTPRAMYHGMELFAYFGWNQSALKLARRAVELFERPRLADGEANPKVVRAQFLAAHHLLIFGGREDIPVAAQLLQQDGSVRVIARPPGIPRGPNLEVRELALMALAKLEKQKPEDLGMVENKVYCPIAHTAKAFYLPKPDDWPAIIARFLPGDDTEEGGAEEAKSDTQN